MTSHKEAIFKVVMIGNQGVGCRSLLRQPMQPALSGAYNENLGANIAVTNFAFPPLQVKLIIWNIIDNPYARNLRKIFSQGAHGVIFVFNVCDRSSFSAIPKWKREVHTNLGDVPTVLVGTHTDLPQSRLVSFYEAAKFAQTHEMSYFDTSTENGPTLTNPLRTLTFQMAKVFVNKFEIAEPP